MINAWLVGELGRKTPLGRLTSRLEDNICERIIYVNGSG
jgi:hypothetical protein